MDLSGTRVKKSVKLNLSQESEILLTAFSMVKVNEKLHHGNYETQKSKPLIFTENEISK
jgi:hypothetical protein